MPHCICTVFTELDQETSDLILRMFHNRDNNGKNVTIIMKNTQKQIGSDDCGLFTIAMMTSLAYKEDPSAVTYDQKNMRQHLQDSAFPPSASCLSQNYNKVSYIYNDFLIIKIVMNYNKFLA